MHFGVKTQCDILYGMHSAIQARLPHLFSCLQYVSVFHSSGDWNGMAGFQVILTKRLAILEYLVFSIDLAVASC
jgi:hypothetical protein